MATTTTNFGWDIPQSTDLVKDGATAIAALGQDIDTALVDLKGGTTGQILAKNSNTDLDYTWINNDQGDITAVTAGTGLTGGGSSGAVTLTNDMATTITAAGDIVVGTGSGTYDNLPIGTTGEVLTADTTVSPYKVKWAAVASGTTFAGCYLYKSGNGTIAHATVTAQTFDSELYDTDGYHSTTTNTSRITIPSGKAGYYNFQFLVEMEQSMTGTRQMRLLKNGSLAYLSAFILANTEYAMYNASITLYGAVNDYFEFALYQESGSTKTVYGGSSYNTWFSAAYLGA